MNLPDLHDALRACCEPDLLARTRIHPLRGFGPEVWIKREDESAFGMPGPKRRKYASLLPWLAQAGFRQVALTGSSHSNHVAGLLQLCRERGIGVRLFLKAEHEFRPEGPRLWTSLLSSPEEIEWIPAAQWADAEQIAAEWARAHDAYAVPEGGTCAPCLPGACTLWLDLLRNEAEQGMAFSRIVLDSGTGLTSAALALMAGYARRDIGLHMVLTAGDGAYWHRQAAAAQQWLRTQFGIDAPLPPRIQLHHPPTARSFGSINAAVRAEMIRMAREEGILCDGIYMAKTMLTLRQLLPDWAPAPVLVIHSGGMPEYSATLR